MAPFDVVVIGNAGVDTNVYLGGSEIDHTVESNFTENIDYVGQAGAYASRGYAALGYRTAFVGSVGADANGEMVRATFEREHIDTRALFVDPLGTARSIILCTATGGARTFMMAKGICKSSPIWMRAERCLLACASLISTCPIGHDSYCHLPSN